MPRGVILSLGVLVLGVAVFGVYFPAADGPFIFDDAGTIVDNPSIRQLWPLVGGGESRGPLNPPRTTAVHGRPLVNLSFAVNYYFGGLDPFGYRMVDIVVHLFSAMLLWAIVARTLRLDYFGERFDRVAEPLSFAAALVWALHPVDTESVIYVTQRTELMMGMFYLATLYCSIRYWTTTRAAVRATCLVGATAACWSGMLSKEMMVSAPVMVLLFERTFVAGTFRRALSRSWPLYVGLGLAWAPLLALNFGGPRTPAAGFGLGVAAHEWWFTQAKVIILYLKLAVWPWPLVIHYEISYLKTAYEAWPWLLATGILAAGTLLLLRRRWSVGFVAVWFFGVLSPTLVIPLVNETAAERRMYLPLAAIVPLLIVGGYVVQERVWRWFKKGSGTVAGTAGHRPKVGRVLRTTVPDPFLNHESIGRGPGAVFFVATMVLAIGFGYVSSHRLRAYRDELSLWQDAVVHQPHDPLVQYNLGNQLAEAGQLLEAISHFEEAVRLDPDSYRAHFNLGRAMEASARPEDAIEHYRATLRLRPDYAASHYNLARLLEDAGQTRQAIEHYRRAIALEPDFSAAHTNLGILKMSAGNVQEAIESFEAALRGQEDLANHVNLAMAYSMANRVGEAIPIAEKALDLARSQNETSLVEELESALAYFRAQRSAPSSPLKK